MDHRQFQISAVSDSSTAVSASLSPSAPVSTSVFSSTSSFSSSSSCVPLSTSTLAPLGSYAAPVSPSATTKKKRKNPSIPTEELRCGEQEWRREGSRERGSKREVERIEE